jgi:hypothetical protein
LLSIIGERRTVQLLDRLGCQARAADRASFEVGALFDYKLEQVKRVEGSSDAYYLSPGTTGAMVAYSWKSSESDNT